MNKPVLSISAIGAFLSLIIQQDKSLAFYAESANVVYRSFSSIGLGSPHIRSLKDRCMLLLCSLFSLNSPTIYLCFPDGFLKLQSQSKASKLHYQSIQVFRYFTCRLTTFLTFSILVIKLVCICLL